MYSINYTHQFKKDMRKCAKRGLDIEEIKTAIKILSETGALPAEYKPHLLKDDRKGQWECKQSFRSSHEILEYAPINKVKSLILQFGIMPVNTVVHWGE